MKSVHAIQDDQFYEEQLLSFESCGEGYAYTTSLGTYAGCQVKPPFIPVIGMTCRFYGKGPYTHIRGFALGGLLLEYQSEEDLKKDRAIAAAKYKVGRDAEADALKAEASKLDDGSLPPATSALVIKAWRAGEKVRVIEMGGMGLGYERGIWEMAFTFLEVMLENPPSKGWDHFKDNKDAWSEYRDRVEADPRSAKCVKDVEPSGAMFGAAMSAASVFANKGYVAGLNMAPTDRIMLLSRE